jgi:hypothetical protein
MITGYCNSQNPQNHVILRQSICDFTIYINGGLARVHRDLAKAQEFFDFASLVLPNICEVKEIRVHNFGTIEVVDWEGKQ